MLEGTKHTKLVDKTVGGSKTTSANDDVRINVRGIYFDNLKDGHQEFPVGNEEDGVPTDDTAAKTSPPTAKKIDDEQRLELFDISVVHKEISQVDSTTISANLIFLVSKKVLKASDEAAPSANVSLGQSNEPPATVSPSELDESDANATGIDVGMAAADGASTDAPPVELVDPMVQTTGPNAFATNADTSKITDLTLLANNETPICYESTPTADLTTEVVDLIPTVVEGESKGDVYVTSPNEERSNPSLGYKI